MMQQKLFWAIIDHSTAFFVIIIVIVIAIAIVIVIAIIIIVVFVIAAKSICLSEGEMPLDRNPRRTENNSME